MITIGDDLKAIIEAYDITAMSFLTLDLVEEETFTGNGVKTSFDLQYDIARIISVHDGNSLLQESAYIFSGNTYTFLTAPANGAEIVIEYFGKHRITEAPRDVTVGSDTFTSSDNLAGLSAPQSQNSVDRDNYTVSFTDNDQAMRKRYAGKSGLPITVQLGFLDSEGQLHSELLDVYKGNSSAVNFKPNGDGFITEIGFTGQLAQLDSNRVRSTTNQSQHQIDSTDQSMQYTHNGAQDDAIKWGRKD